MMFSMTCTTIEICFTKADQTMQAGWILQLGSDVGVADQTTICHGIRIPRGGMTGTALLYLSM